MSDKYTREDVIIWPDDPRLVGAIGKLVYWSDSVMNIVERANEDLEARPLTAIYDGCMKMFAVDDNREQHICIIIKKEPKKKYIPFDFSLEEDRAKVRGKYFIYTKKKNVYREDMCCGFYEGKIQMVESYVPEKDFLECYTFLDGSPCGKEVEE